MLKAEQLVDNNVYSLELSTLNNVLDIGPEIVEVKYLHTYKVFCTVLVVLIS